MTPTAHLKELYLQDNRKRFPSLPEPVRSCPKYTDRTATGLSRMILDFLKLKGWQAERISVTGRYLDNSRIVTDVTGRQRRIGSGTWIKPSMQPGTADLSAVIKGKAVKIEVKIGRDRQSKAQKIYQQQVEQAGGAYMIATDFVQFFEWYNTFLANREKSESYGK